MSTQQTLQKWIPDSKKTKLSVFDFDSTLFLSPNREDGEIKFLKETGNPWPFDGWWGRVETLSHPLVPDPIPESFWIQKTLEAFREDKKDFETLTVMMTGRPYKIRKRVQEILASQNLEFDQEFYRGMKGQKGKDTIDIKTNILETEVFHNYFELIKIYEDRPEHLSHFMTMAKKWRSRFKNLKKIIIFDVPNDLNYEF